MTRKMFLHGLALAVTLMVPALAAPKTTAGAASCCAANTRCCDKVKFCCDQPDKAECCKKGIACCDKTPCCGPVAKVKTTKRATGTPVCCAKKVKKAAADAPAVHTVALVAAEVRCSVTGQPKRACCPTKASPMPPCCQKSCDVLVA